MIRTLACLVTVMTCSPASRATDAGACTTVERPQPQETAFAAVGQALKVIDVTCIGTRLHIPFDQQAGAVNLPAGTYMPLAGAVDGRRFALQGDRAAVTSCPWCDPLSCLVITQDTPPRLCVRSRLGITSCAAPDAVSWALIPVPQRDLGRCTPALIYAGREGATLAFSVTDCRTAPRGQITYDLRLGAVIRFLNERFKILRADNQGVYYQRLPPAPAPAS